MKFTCRRTDGYDSLTVDEEHLRLLRGGHTDRQTLHARKGKRLAEQTSPLHMGQNGPVAPEVVRKHQHAAGQDHTYLIRPAARH